MFDTLFVFALIICAGAIFKAIYADTEPVKEGINKVVLSVMLPALCIKTFAKAEIAISLLLVPVSAWLIILSSTLIGLIAARLMARYIHLSTNETGVLVLSTAFGNLIYLGIPVLSSLYGLETVKYALLFDFLAGTILAWTLGAFIASYYGDRDAFSLKASAKTILSLPPLWGICLGLMLNIVGLEPQGFFLKTLDMLAGAVAPLMIFSIGLSLGMPSIKHTLALLPFVTIKLFLSPLLAFFITGFLGLEGIARKAAVIEAAMPVMILLLMVANRYRLNESLTALAITLSTALSFITLPFVAYMLERFL